MTTANANATLQKLTNSANQRKEMELLMAPYADWDQFLIPAPLTVALLGQLILVSTGTEFSLADTPPKNGFQLINRPSSFRATLSQISHHGWDAFNMSDRAMDQIRIHASVVPTHLKDAVKILMTVSLQFANS